MKKTEHADFLFPSIFLFIRDFFLGFLNELEARMIHTGMATRLNGHASLCFDFDVTLSSFRHFAFTLFFFLLLLFGFFSSSFLAFVQSRIDSALR